MVRQGKYKSITECFAASPIPRSSLQSKDNYEAFMHPVPHYPSPEGHNPSQHASHSPQQCVEMDWNTIDTKTTVDPAVWGPAFWFSLHNGAAKYPVHASKICADKMKGFMLGMPYILPCVSCAEHARVHLEKHYNDLDYITSGREPLFAFFVDFHNYVNRRYNKPEMSVEEAKKLYNGDAKLRKLSYK